jgi:protein ImuB
MNSAGKLYACLYARELPAQAALRLRSERRDRAVVIFEGEPPLETVCSFNAKARYLGVARGMTKVDLDTFPSVVVLPRSRTEEVSAHAVLLECAGAFSPRVEDRSDGCSFLCVIDIAGTEKLLGPPQVLARELLRRVQAVGVSASVAISRNFHAAICCARGSTARITIIAGGNESRAIAPLPLKVLNVSSDHVETFALWGIRTLGALAALPEKELIARIGQEGRRLRQLARGELPHHFVPREAAFALEERMELDSPVEQQESLLFVVSIMLEQLILRAGARVLALASVTITLTLDGSAAHVRTVRPALPTTTRHHTDLDHAGRLLALNNRRHLRPAREMAALFRDVPGAVAQTLELSARLRFQLDDLGYEFPRYPVPDGETMDSFLSKRVAEGVMRRYRRYS